jgi:hypothetical protein
MEARMLRELAARCRRTRTRTILIAAAAVAGSGLLAQGAAATVVIQNHTDPAGDPATFAYHLDLPGGRPPADFVLRDGGQMDFGPFEGTVVATSNPPAGWQVADIRCTGADLTHFDIDIAHGRVTMQHRINDDQICAFTHRRIDEPGTATPASPPTASSDTGLAPAPPTSSIPLIVAPRRAALLHVFPRRRAVTARVNIVRRSVIKTQLLWRGRVVALSRVVRPAGLYDVTLRLAPSFARRLRHEGRRRVTVALRMVVVPRPGATSVFRYGVIVPL